LGHYTLKLNVLAFAFCRSIVYIVFVPSLVFSSLANTVTLKDIISWFGFTSTLAYHSPMNSLGFD
jgi:predicted permease